VGYETEVLACHGVEALGLSSPCAQSGGMDSERRSDLVAVGAFGRRAAARPPARPGRVPIVQAHPYEEICLRE
jgi:hypothetical protein